MLTFVMEILNYNRIWNNLFLFQKKITQLKPHYFNRGTINITLLIRLKSLPWGKQMYANFYQKIANIQ